MACGRICRMLNSDTEMSGILPLCLVASTGVGITFVSLLPLGPDTPAFQREVLYITGKLSLSAINLIIIFQLFRFIRNKRKYHENLTVFWPMRCSHCAVILGLPTSKSSHTSPVGQMLNLTRNVLYENPVYQSPRCRTGRQTSFTSSGGSSSPQLSDSSLCPVFSSDLLDTNLQPAPGTIQTEFPQNGYMNRKRNSSFLKIYGVLLIFTSLGTALGLISSITCFLHIQGRNVNRISMVSTSIQSIVLIALIPVSMQFAINYYDAVFATTIENIFTMVLFVSGSVWISIFKIATPVNELLKSPYSLPDGPCSSNGSLSKVEQRAVRMLTPFNAECAIIALCILWHIWISFVRRASLPLTTVRMPQTDIFQGDSYIDLIKNYLLRCKAYMIRRKVHQNTLQHPLIQDLHKCLRKTWVLTTSFSILHFTVIFYIDVVDPFKDHFSYKAEIMWSADLIFLLPFFFLHMHQSYVSRHSQETFTLISPRKVQSHDVLLLLCSCGIFCHSIMRLAAGCGLLLGDPSDSNISKLKALSIYAIVYSLAIILMIWLMTAFILQVQGIYMTNICEIKWTLVFLIYISLSSGTRWLCESIIINIWNLQRAFYGDNAGNVVGTLLEPFVTLYGLHSAMVAYEAYKTILQEAEDQYAPVENLVLVDD